MIFMNGQFPGPELRIDEGDNVEVGWLLVNIFYIPFC
jgi:hypothetical protein